MRSRLAIAGLTAVLATPGVASGQLHLLAAHAREGVARATRPSAVPKPASTALLGSGVLALGAVVGRRRMNR